MKILQPFEARGRCRWFGSFGSFSSFSWFGRFDCCGWTKRQWTEMRKLRTFISTASAFLLSSWSAQASSAAEGPATSAKVTQEDIEAATQKMEKAYAKKGLRYSSEIPTNFPIPTYPNILSKNFTTTTHAPIIASEVLTTKDDLKTVYQWYITACTRASWTIRTHKPENMSKLEKAGTMSMFNAEKGNQQLNVYCMKIPKGSGTSVSVNFFLKAW